MRHFEVEMNDLKKCLLDMSDLVQEMIKTTINGLVKRDLKLFDTVFCLEKEVNIQEIVIDDKCLKLMALNQPVGTDLRFITSAARISTDLERMGDEAVNISERAVNLIKYPELKPLIDIPKMSDIVQQMVTDSIKAFNTNDVELANSVLVKDDEVDNLKDTVFKDLKVYMTKSTEPDTIERAVDLMLVAKSLERIGDHATNISEDVIFMVHGKDVRHPRTCAAKTE
ncbi:MAG: phosphate signaling complex protein PhoU [Endomicrobia bacterium]|nr:phosphate signaling complex protein PhoU [Endomicrobiia bacterium]MCL2799077.1 phosphate signaling complex protein PhoU [Endomicrobiia bacterium]